MGRLLVTMAYCVLEKKNVFHIEMMCNKNKILHSRTGL